MGACPVAFHDMSAFLSMAGPVICSTQSHVRSIRPYHLRMHASRPHRAAQHVMRYLSLEALAVRQHCVGQRLRDTSEHSVAPK